MNIEVVTDKIKWNKWLADNSQFSSFPQSWEWGEILMAEGKKVERLLVVENGEVVAAAQVVYSNLPFGWKYAFCPKGPVIGNLEIRKLGNYNENTLKGIYHSFFNYLKDNRCIFFRIEPQFLNFSISQFLKVIDINPRATVIADLAKSENELLAAMHQKTRYNIRLAEKKGLVINNEKNFEVFWKLMQETGKRDGFKLHEEEHYKKIFDSNFSLQSSVFYDNEPVAVGIFIGFGNVFTYLYGASSYAHRSLMAPYLVQWEGMKTGKKLGYEFYDWFGIAPRSLNCHSERSEVSRSSTWESLNAKRDPSAVPQDDSYEYDLKHQYAGVTRFKLGFGGNPHEDPGTFDLLISPMKYRMYQLLRKLRRLF